MRRLSVPLAAVLIVALAWSCAPRREVRPEAREVRPMELALSPSTVAAPEPRREFRGVWMASVDNINWPSRPGLSAAEQQAELKLLMDNAVAAGFNAVLLQVRPSADALYRSSLEPWSAYLTGVQGQDPGYDPLEFAVAEAQRRGLALHAWINPFRVKARGRVFPRGPGNIADRHPEWVRPYGTLEWMDPGIPAAREHSLRVIEDIVARYDIDGIHIDDYFYPYVERGPDGRDIEFPDDASFAAYGGGLPRAQWRRQNINNFVREMYQRVKATKPWVKVGISPFGIWRPGHPPQIRGMDAYDRIYADSRLWLREGWADYFSPQLYWAIDRREQSFPALLHWWIGENVQGRHLWPGIFTTRADESSTRSRKEWEVEEIEYQIRITRGMAGAGGVIHFSASFLQPTTRRVERPVAPHLAATVYGEPALIPATPWLAEGPPPPAVGDVRARQVGERVEVSWGPVAARWVVVQSRQGQAWRQTVVPGQAGSAHIEGEGVSVIAVRAVDRLGMAGPPVTMDVRWPQAEAR